MWLYVDLPFCCLFSFVNIIVWLPYNTGFFFKEKLSRRSTFFDLGYVSIRVCHPLFGTNVSLHSRHCTKEKPKTNQHISYRCTKQHLIISAIEYCIRENSNVSFYYNESNIFETTLHIAAYLGMVKNKPYLKDCPCQSIFRCFFNPHQIIHTTGNIEATLHIVSTRSFNFLIVKNHNPIRLLPTVCVLMALSFTINDIKNQLSKTRDIKCSTTHGGPSSTVSKPIKTKLHRIFSLYCTAQNTGD